MFTYPKTDLDKAEIVRSLLGGYWNEVYDGKDQVSDIVDARIVLWKDVFEAWEEAVRSKSRFNINPLKTKSWVYFRMLKSNGVSTQSSFGGGGSYGISSINFGTTTGPSWKLPSDIKGVSQIYNRISAPSASFFEGVDYSINSLTGHIVFNKDPFLKPKFAVRDVTVNGLPDQEMALWLYRPKVDQRSIQQIYGLPIGLDGESNDDYKGIVNTVYDCLILGMSKGRLAQLLGFALQSPVCRQPEIVEMVHDQVRKVVITDKSVYQLPGNSSSIVSPGDTMIPGDQVSNAISIRELRRGSSIDGITSLSVTKGWIDNGFAYDLHFTNESLPTTVDSIDGVTELRFKVGGHPFDLEYFWSEVHLRGLAKEKTIAQGLDQRAEKIGEPDSASLPKFINPLQFLVDEMMPGGITLVTIKVDCVGTKFNRLDVVPDLVALGNGVFFIFEAPLAIDSIFEVQSSNENSYTGAEPLEGYDAFDLINSVVTIKSISSQCS